MDLLSTFNMIQGQQRYQQAQQQDQDQKIASGIMSRLDEYKSDPARFSAFKTQFIDSDPTIKGSLERVYTPKGLAAMLDTSTMQTQDDRNKIKQQDIISSRRSQAMAEVDPVVLGASRKAKEYQAETENFINLKPTIVEAKAKQTENEAIAKARAVEAEQTSDVGKRNLFREKELAREKELPNFEAQRAVVMSNFQDLSGMTPEEVETQVQQWDQGVPGAGVNNINNSMQGLIKSYQTVRLKPIDWVKPSHINPKVQLNESEYKNEEQSILQTLHAGFKYVQDKGGKKVKVPLSEADRLRYLGYLKESELMDGEPSPYMVPALPLSTIGKKSGDNVNSKRLRESIRKLATQNWER
jgi:hypothetical protein